MKILKFKKLFVLVLSFLLFIVSCKEEKFVENTPDQLFRPVSFIAGKDGNKITFSWVPIANSSYLLELSRDSLIFSTDRQEFTIEENSSLEVENLWSNTLYSARIKAVSKNPQIKDSEYKQITFTTGTENIFYGVTVEDVGSNQVLLKWVIGKDVSHIVVSTAGVANVTVPLVDSDKLTGTKLLQNLNANTNYVFEIYLGEMLRGTLTIKTLS